MRIAIAITVALAVTACTATPVAKTEPAEPVKQSVQPPPLVTLEGASVPWSELVVPGKRTLVVFMTPWCHECLDEQPDVEEFARAHQPDTRVFYAVAGTTSARAKEVADERKIAIPVYADPDGSFTRYFKVVGTPTLLLFDGTGQLIATYGGIDQLGRDSQSERTGSPKAVIDSGSEIGTSYDVVVLAENEQQALKDLASARQVVHEAEKHLSEWKEDSDISRLNREAGDRAVEVHGDLLKLIRASKQVSIASGGAFDITWLPLGAMWKEARETGRLPTQEQTKAVLEAVGQDKVAVEGSTIRYLHPQTRIGLGGVAKGWIVDAVFLHLRKCGYQNLIVNIGGDLRTAGRGPEGAWTFQIKDPYNPEKIVGTFDLEDGSVATSGNYLRFVEIEGRRYGHILDPRTGWPAKFDGSVTVFTPDCAMADALATALFVMGPEEGMKWVKQNPGVKVIYATREGLTSDLG